MALSVHVVLLITFYVLLSAHIGSGIYFGPERVNDSETVVFKV